MNVNGQRVQLKTGGQLVYSEYGDLAGMPVLFCHGWPSSRTMAELTDVAARELGIRIISPDRPGIFESSFQPQRTLLDWPAAVDDLMSHLRVGRFRILGISGGAPYAYVTGRAFPDRVEAIAVVSGAPPIAELEDRRHLLGLYRRLLWLHKNQPQLLRAFFRIARPFATFAPAIRLRPLLLKLLQPCDAAALRDSASFDACFESARRGWRGSADGVMTDAEIYATPWGFSLEDVNVPVRLWHGTEDRSFSYLLAEQVAARLPNCELRLVEHAGHYSLPIRHMREILADVIIV
ncbi:MAG: alpha/beta hydrolase [Chthoniobacterales bacterium]